MFQTQNFIRFRAKFPDPFHRGLLYYQ